MHQRDVRPPNLLWNEELGRVILIDFEFATLIPKRERQAEAVTSKSRPMLGEIDCNDRHVRQRDVKAAAHEESDPLLPSPSIWAE